MLVSLAPLVALRYHCAYAWLKVFWRHLMKMGPRESLSGGNLNVAVDRCCIAFNPSWFNKLQSSSISSFPLSCPHVLKDRIEVGLCPMMKKLVIYIATMCTQQLVSGCVSSSRQLVWLCIVLQAVRNGSLAGCIAQQASRQHGLPQMQSGMCWICSLTAVFCALLIQIVIVDLCTCSLYYFDYDLTCCEFCR